MLIEEIVELKEWSTYDPSKVKSVKEFSNIVLSMPQAFGVRKDIIRKSIQSNKWF